MAKEGSLPIGGDTVCQLQSQEQAGLLDAIDTLRRENIDADIEIPQIVVCGDQSSGKSSLLEAIAQLPFPAGSGAVTMFATELVLRRDRCDAVYASILPSWSRTVKQREAILKFQYRPEKLDRDEFRNLFALASDHLEAVDQTQGFRYDKLRIEVSGPTQPHLTLIDLPGLIRTTKGRQGSGAVDAIYELTRSYLQKPRTIVLAVVSATADFQVQSVGDFMRNPEIAQHMMGVITKPDGVLSQDDALKSIDMARNEELRLGFGWHVVRNLSHEAKDRTPEHWDLEERRFFTSSVWSRLPSKDLGIESLRQKLCQRLFESIKRDLPLLIQEMDSQLKATHCSIEQLGSVRSTAKDCLWYLAEIKRSMYQLAVSASDGVYDDPNTSEFFGKGDFAKLRHSITNSNHIFNQKIRSSGKTFIVLQDTEQTEPMIGVEVLEPVKPVFQPPYYASRHDEGPYTLTVDSYCKVLSSAMIQNRGKNLPDLPNFRDIQAVFRSQSIRWDSLAKAHIESCYDDTAKFMSEAMLHVAGEHTSSKLLDKYVRPALELRRAALVEKLDELLWPYTKCHPITSHPEYTSMPRLLLEPGDTGMVDLNEPGTMWSHHAQTHRFSTDSLHAAHVLDRAEAYYEIALDTFIDNVATLAIERVLLRDLPNLVFSSCEPSSLSDEELEAVAGESAEIKEQRTKAIHRAAALEAVISTCRKYKCISQSTPQKATLSPSKSSLHGAPCSDGTTITPSSPSNSEASNLDTADGQLPTPPSPSSSPNRNSGSSAHPSTLFSSPGSVSHGKNNNSASESIVYRPASGSSKGGKSRAASVHLNPNVD